MFRRFVPLLLLSWPNLPSAEVLPPALAEDYSGLVDNGPKLNMGLVRNGNTADNYLGGTNLRDAFWGAKGNDFMVGYDSYDTYTFELGDGADTIVDHSATGNRIRFRDVPEDLVEKTEVPGFNEETDLLLTYGETDAIRVVGWSKLSDETKSAWTIEHVFVPKAEPVPERPRPIAILLTDPRAVGMILLLLFFSCFPLARLLWYRWRNK